jgi:NitT/TauT family transport system substrate-binding protein
MINRRTLMLSSLALSPVRALDFDALPVTILMPEQQNLIFSLMSAMLNGNYFRAVGLDVTLLREGGELNHRPLTLKLTDINAFLSDKTGANLIYTLVDSLSAAIIGRKSRGITDNLTSLYGKNLGAPPSTLSNRYLLALLKHNKIDADKITIEAIGANLREPMLASGEMDAILGSPALLIPSLKAKNVPLDDVITLNFSALNCPLYGLGLIANDKSMEDHKEPLARLKTAITKALNDFERDASPVSLNFSKVNDIAPELALEQVQYYLSESIFTPFARQNGLGTFDQSRLEIVAKILGFKP